MPLVTVAHIVRKWVSQSWCSNRTRPGIFNPTKIRLWAIAEKRKSNRVCYLSTVQADARLKTVLVGVSHTKIQTEEM